MNKALRGILIVVLLAAGFFCGYGIFYANNSIKVATAFEDNLTELSESDVFEGKATEAEEKNSEGSERLEAGQALPTADRPMINRMTPGLQGEVQYVEAANLNDILILANKNWNLPEDYVPEDLVPVESEFVSYALPERRQLRSEAAAALQELIEASKLDWMEILCVSGYRSYETQKVIFDNKVKAAGLDYAVKYVAYPGQSEHQTGLAMDLTSKDMVTGVLTESFGETKEGKWLVDNAHRFGFIIRYPAGKENITGYNYEPWHIRYVGAEVAHTIYRQGITLEEYLGLAQQVLQVQEPEEVPSDLAD